MTIKRERTVANMADKDMTLEEKLHRLISPMNLPAHRKMQKTPANYMWLYKNLSEKNATHKNFTDALNILRNILKEG